MTKLRICDCCTGLGREPNTVLPSPTALPRRLAAALVLALVVGCQGPASTPPTVAPVPPTPPPATQAPTAAPSVPTPVPATPTAGPVATSRPVPPTSQATAPPVGTSRVDTLNAANAAFGTGDLKTALGLYDRVVNTPPPSSEGDTATTAIDDFANFRAMVTLLADGQDDEAHSHLDQLEKRDATAPLARLGSQLYDQYGMTGQLRGACAQIQPSIQTQAGPTLTTLKGLGVTVDAATLCSVKAA
jgi:hypothetical protein